MEYAFPLLVTGSLLSAFFVVRWLLKRPPRYKRSVGDDLTKFFRPLLDPMYPASILIIEVGNNKDLFIQFRRYEKNGGTGIRFDFPHANWSDPYFSDLRELLDKQGVTYVIEPTEQSTVTSFLTVEFEEDVRGASQFATTVLQSVFGLGPEHRLRLYLSR